MVPAERERIARKLPVDSNMAKKKMLERRTHMCEPEYAARAALTAAFVASVQRYSKGGGFDCMLHLRCSCVTSSQPASTFRLCPMRGAASSPQSSSPPMSSSSSAKAGGGGDKGAAASGAAAAGGGAGMGVGANTYVGRMYS